MTKAPSNLQDLRRSLYVKAKAEPSWRFWGLYVHVQQGFSLREIANRENRSASGVLQILRRAGVSGGAK